ncbi:unnamed protein product, partial [Ectocarpus sp. 4 AP-2014]
CNPTTSPAYYACTCGLLSIVTCTHDDERIRVQPREHKTALEGRNRKTATTTNNVPYPAHIHDLSPRDSTCRYTNSSDRLYTTAVRVTNITPNTYFPPPFK